MTAGTDTITFADLADSDWDLMGSDPENHPRLFTGSLPKPTPRGRMDRRTTASGLQTYEAELTA